MSVSYEHPTELPATQGGLEIVPDLHHSRAKRLLGAAAVDKTSNHVFARILNEADEFTVEQTKPFAQLIHTLLRTRLQEINPRHGWPKNQFQVKPERVTNALADYWHVFREWPNRLNPAAYLEVKRQEYLLENREQALTVRKAHPEINWLAGLEIQLLEQAGETAGNVAGELMAAYGWATRDDFAAYRMKLFRQTENIDRL